MGIEIVICHSLPDAALAQRIAGALNAAGHRARCVPDSEPAPVSPGPHLLLLLWSARSATSVPLRRAMLAQPRMRLLEVCLAGALPPAASRLRAPLPLASAHADLQPLLDAARAMDIADDPLAAFDPFAELAGNPSPAFDDFPELLGGTFGGPRQSAGEDPLQEPLAPASAQPASAGAEPPEPAAEAKPVLLAASAPRRCTAGSGFTAALVVYVDAARESALRRLEQFGESGDRVVSDLAPDGDARWRVGAPVTVRLAGPHLTLTPAARQFDWNGRENAAAFAVSVDADAPAGTVELCFAVDLAGVPMAFIPMRVTIDTAPATADAALPAPPTEAAAPRSIFVSYSSKDAASVTQRLSTLIRWSPGLDIFQDCLDLTANEAFKPQLAAQIGMRDRFVLFWSRNAAASPWVRWEYETARDGKGLTAILPMPLEDPAIAPPPAEFADAHWRDRFMLAGYALAAIREQAATP